MVIDEQTDHRHEPGVRHYELGRPALSHVDLIKTIDDAFARARLVKPEDAASRFAFELRYLLPTHARDLGERWEPSAVLPRGIEAKMVRDDWTRLGAYLGAIDAWAGLDARQPRGPGLAWWDFACSYSTGFMLVLNLREMAKKGEVARG